MKPLKKYDIHVKTCLVTHRTILATTKKEARQIAQEAIDKYVELNCEKNLDVYGKLIHIEKA